jgi:branched-chain amino acid transport system ATP-binding protein
LLEIDGVSTYYGNIRALHGVSLRVEAGEIVTLIGANGAGKTTLLNTISGLTPARTGKIRFENRAIERASPVQVVRQGISHVPERRQIFATMTVLDNLILGGYSRFRQDGRAKVVEDIKQVYEHFPVLRERQKQLAGTLSGGEQQMLAIGRGLIARPRLLLLDEPSLGLAPLLVQEIFQVMAELRRNGTTILLVEQNARAALSMADRGYVMETGKIVLAGTAAELVADQRVQGAYLGKK